jgi:hypothetical protein
MRRLGCMIRRIIRTIRCDEGRGDLHLDTYVDVLNELLARYSRILEHHNFLLLFLVANYPNIRKIAFIRSCKTIQRKISSRGREYVTGCKAAPGMGTG